MPDVAAKWRKVVHAIILTILLVGMGTFLWFQVKEADEAARASVCKGNIFLLALQLHNYHVVEGRLPPAYATDPDGKPLSSWRVLLTPYLDQDELFEKYDLDAAWDHEANLKLGQDEDFVYRFGCPTHPEFRDPRDSNFDRHQPRFTNYVVVVGPGTAFPETGEAVTFDDITDGLENTILLVEIANSDIHWSEPRDLRWEEMSFRINDPEKPSISSYHPGGPYVVFADGRVQRIAESMPPETLKALLTINGGESVSRRELRQLGHLK